MRSGDLVGEALDGVGTPQAGTMSGADEIDLLRAEYYDLLASLLGRAPTAPVLSQLATLSGDSTVLGSACAALRIAAEQASVRLVEREYFDLFIGVGRGELMPYASYYLTGFLNERPLARVREDLARLGIARGDAMSEPEDHVAILLETMAGLAAGRFGAEPGADRAFFLRHLQPWVGRFFNDVAVDRGSSFYRAVGMLGRAFVEIETEAFALDASEARVA